MAGRDRRCFARAARQRIRFETSREEDVRRLRAALCVLRLKSAGEQFAHARHAGFSIAFACRKEFPVRTRRCLAAHSGGRTNHLGVPPF